ncbi:MAG: flagellar assembly peptidoglycan hydrolase FlgJ [Gammaproteobacteria bacterium]|nr:flagellar assembly peptidoglycan hydrolase FlgJ [Gammaproteobacteria bacterium]MDH5776565.1 flagellar assembly peptidoglycan hydrolase FlgJ [Gammaproteobacteria bacterium]
MQAQPTAYTYTDISGLNDLKRAARLDQKGALLDVARQFESMFMKMMLKSMRDASFGDPIFDNNQSMFYRDMFDNQLALSLSKGKGMGLAELLARQLGQQLPDQQKQDEVTAVKNTKDIVSLVNRLRTSAPTNSSPEGVPEVKIKETRTGTPIKTNQLEEQHKDLSRAEKFVQKLWPIAERAAEELNTQPEVLIAQAALETGWGKYVNKDEQGKNSFNLFNIKAGKNWDGNYIEKNTVEFKYGKPVTENARFRAYDSYEDSFKDYVSFLKSNKRYASALQVAEIPSTYIRRLHQAGYATDPAYADKILNIMQREEKLFDKYSTIHTTAQNDV